MGLEVGETSRSDVRTLEDVSLFGSKELALVEPYLEELCGDLVMGTDTPIIGPTNPIANEPLDLTPHFIPFTSCHSLSFACIS